MGWFFDGVDDQVSSGTEIIGVVLTIMAWVKPTALGEVQEGFIVAQGTGTTPRHCLQFINAPVANTFHYFANRSPDGNWNGPADQVVFDVWQNIAMTVDGNTTNPPLFYYNGQPIAVSVETVPVGAYGPPDDTVIYLGNNSGINRTIAGLLGPVVIWPRILTPVEIANVFIIGPGLMPDYTQYWHGDWAGQPTANLGANQQFPRGGGSLTTVGCLSAENPPGWRVFRRG